MDPQRQAVANYLGPQGPIAEFIEVERGRNSNRPQLLAAIAECRSRKAVLIIAKLDRLARNVAFVANLMDSDVEFIATDMPSANRLTIHIMGAVAEHEREMISQRTKLALAQAKARGTKLGNSRAAEAAAIARAAKGSYAAPPEVVNLMMTWRTQGRTLRYIAGAKPSADSHKAGQAMVRLHDERPASTVSQHDQALSDSNA